MKYWDSRRVRRVRERRIRKEREKAALQRAARERERSYEPGHTDKNAGLMLDALGHSDRRAMILRLQKGGAMSLSKLAEPFGMKLSTAHAHAVVLQRSGIISSHKRGRVRICVYNPRAFRELRDWLASH